MNEHSPQPLETMQKSTVEVGVQKSVRNEALESTDALEKDLKIRSSYVTKKSNIFHAHLHSEFCIKLFAYSTKNNVMFLLTDMMDNIFYKKTGGNQVKKGGSLKNSQKVAQKNFEDIVSVIQDVKAKYIQPVVNKGFGTKKHNGTAKAVQKILESFDPKDITIEPILNATPTNWSYLRLTNKRGRR